MHLFILHLLRVDGLRESLGTFGYIDQAVVKQQYTVEAFAEFVITEDGKIYFNLTRKQISVIKSLFL